MRITSGMICAVFLYNKNNWMTPEAARLVRKIVDKGYAFTKQVLADVSESMNYSVCKLEDCGRAYGAFNDAYKVLSGEDGL